jgi:hypothetical protein
VAGTVNPSYTYDAIRLRPDRNPGFGGQDGNMTAGAGRTVSYFSFNMASVIQQGSVSTTLHYDTEHQRFTSAPNANSFTYYLNDPASGSMSELLETSTTATWHDFVLAEGRIVAERFLPNGGSATWNYFVGDHLGSTSVVTDASGNVLERDSYDAWGKDLGRARAGAISNIGEPCSAAFSGQTERLPFAGQREAPSRRLRIAAQFGLLLFRFSSPLSQRNRPSAKEAQTLRLFHLCAD